MIVAETPTGYRFVTQPDHARLAGQFAGHWGGGTFEPPAPTEPVVLAARIHDDGWAPYDRRPHLGDAGTPIGFTEVPAVTWIGLYDRGIERAVDLDRYAGLLVAMHGTGLRRRRYGLSPSWPDTPPAFADFVDRQEARQRELRRSLRDDDRVSAADAAVLDALHETGTPPEDPGGRLWTNYVLLEAWDALSLACCTTVPPPGRGAIDRVPTHHRDGEVTLSLDGRDGGIAVDPYPFTADPLAVGVPTRTVPKAAIETEDELAAAYGAAERERVSIEFQSPR